MSFLKMRMLVYFPTDSCPYFAKGCSGRKGSSLYFQGTICSCGEGSQANLFADSVYGKPTDYVEMVNTRVMGWGADIILQMMEVAKPVPLPPRHSWSGYLTPSVMAVLSLRSTWCFLFSALSSVISSDQVLSHVRLFVTPWAPACQASLSITTSQSLLKPMSIESVMPSNHLILCHPLLLPPPIPPSIRVFSN